MSTTAPAQCPLTYPFSEVLEPLFKLQILRNHFPINWEALVVPLLEDYEQLKT